MWSIPVRISAGRDMRFQNRITSRLAFLTLSAFISYWAGCLHVVITRSSGAGHVREDIADQLETNQFDAANYH
jgi:hypothetical protein